MLKKPKKLGQSFFAILFIASCYVSTVSSKKVRSKAQPRRPNIVVFMTDDQDVQLGSMDYMTKTKEKNCAIWNDFQ